MISWLVDCAGIFLYVSHYTFHSIWWLAVPNLAGLVACQADHKFPLGPSCQRSNPRSLYSWFRILEAVSCAWGQQVQTTSPHCKVYFLPLLPVNILTIELTCLHEIWTRPGIFLENWNWRGCPPSPPLLPFPSPPSLPLPSPVFPFFPPLPLPSQIPFP